MLFKTNSQLEFKNPFKQTDFDRHYPIFEVTLNVGLFHADITVIPEDKDDIYTTRLIAHDLDQILGTINEEYISKADLYYQIPIWNDNKGYRIMKVKTLKSHDDGLTFTFTNGEIHKDSYQRSRERGIVFNA